MAEALLLDTSAVLAATERNNHEVQRIISGHGEPSIRSLFVLGELLHGVGVATVRSVRRDRQQTVNFYEKITGLAHGSSIDLLAKLYGQVSATATGSGLRVGMNDRWIVAEAVLHMARLVTCDGAQLELARQFGCETIYVARPS